MRPPRQDRGVSLLIFAVQTFIPSITGEINIRVERIKSRVMGLSLGGERWGWACGFNVRWQIAESRTHTPCAGCVKSSPFRYRIMFTTRSRFLDLVDRLRRRLCVCGWRANAFLHSKCTYLYLPYTFPYIHILYTNGGYTWTRTRKLTHTQNTNIPFSPTHTYLYTCIYVTRADSTSKRYPGFGLVIFSSFSTR